MKRLTKYALSLSLPLLVTNIVKADMYKYTAAPDNAEITIDEGQTGLVHYTFTNLGTEPIFIFTFGIGASHPVLPDRTDNAGAHYFGLDRSLGIEVESGDTFKFGYQLTTHGKDKRPEHKGDPDLGLEIFDPHVNLGLREGPKITSPFLPKDAGTIKDFSVTVIDSPATPEAGSLGLATAGVAVLLALGFTKKRA